MFQDKKLNTVSAILMAVFGLILVIWAGSALKITAIVIGVLLLLEAVALFISYFQDKETPKLIEGIVSAIIGLVFVIKPTFIVSIYPFLLGAVIVVESILHLVQLFGTSVKTGRTWGLIAANVVLLILGIVIMFNPFTTMTVLVRVSGIVMIIDAFLGLLFGVQL